MALAGVAVAATDNRDNRASRSILAAALALPGVVAGAAAVLMVPAVQAESAPEEGTVGIKMLRYQESQPGLKRVEVKAPSVYLLTPIGPRWSLEASAVQDEVSGASPRYYSDVSGASVMHDERTAGDLKLTRHFERAAVGLGLSLSKENDYRSRALSLDTRIASADNNTTWNFGIGRANDRIDPSNQRVSDERKRTGDYLIGVTQAWSPRDLVQANLTLSRGQGYFNDPYKTYDARPRERNSQALLLRWNHRGPQWSGTLRSSYRYYRDSFGVRAHTTEAAWVQNLGERVTVTPLLRYYTQRAASFYFDPSSNPANYPAPDVWTPYYSNDQRLSAFGAVTAGVKVDWKITRRWTVDLKLERYQQRSSWRLGGEGSPGLAPFSANWMQLGLSSTF
ncbi:MAG: DUF3570 domain-containing protein [Burkholderiales bacterium]|jgi:hypothetical protein|nr:DUF3570 domain-containing protein [Burkholderiales bacterium]MBP6250394.1 DUF3570 domain-containing protein [Leptothrix sp. (in: b-proteobacteria)]MBP7521394.1 DUF3570 domain-containing protein [Leptothrix sp. (in: b-proteobacteria)]HQY09828.1 DUF3570 domain-containing protein [Burkholderiaceae bacterium]